MSIRLLNLVRKVDREALSHYEKMVLMDMSLYGKDDGTSIFPSYKTIADNLSMSVRGVIKVVKSLIRKCLLLKIPRLYGAKQYSNVYAINVELLKSIVAKSSVAVNKVVDSVKAMLVDNSVDKPVDNLTPPVNQSVKNGLGGGEPGSPNTLIAFLEKANSAAATFEEAVRGMEVEYPDGYIHAHLELAEARDKGGVIRNKAAWIRKAVRQNWAKFFNGKAGWKVSKAFSKDEPPINMPRTNSEGPRAILDIMGRCVSQEGPDKGSLPSLSPREALGLMRQKLGFSV